MDKQHSETQKFLPEIGIVNKVSITEIPYSSVPQPAAEKLMRRLEWCQTRNATPDQAFDSIYKVDAHDGIESYAGIFTFKKDDLIENSKRIEVVDSFGNDILGFGSAWLLLDSKEDIYLNQPFVAFTNTTPEYINKGLGTRRIQLLDALCQNLWSMRLRSSDSILPEAEAVWQKLYKKGLVEVWFTKPRGQQIYRFLDKLKDH